MMDAARTLALPLLGALGVVATPLIEEFGASATQLGIGMSLALFAAALAGPAPGAALDRGPLRAIMVAGVVLLFVSVFALSRGTALWQLAAAFAGAVVGMSMYGMLPVQVVLVNWFVLRRGTALSLAYVRRAARGRVAREAARGGRSDRMGSPPRRRSTPGRSANRAVSRAGCAIATSG